VYDYGTNHGYSYSDYLSLGGIYRTKPKKRTRVNAAIIWSVLAEKLAGLSL